MDSASLRSLTPLLDGIDRWVELAPLLPVIVSLELVLSADNAVALASITKNLNNIADPRISYGALGKKLRSCNAFPSRGPEGPKPAIAAPNDPRTLQKRTALDPNMKIS